MKLTNNRSGETFPIRTANIGTFFVITASSAAVIQFGDRGETTARLRGLAVQRQEDHTTAGDFFFESYEIYNRPLPVLVDPDYDNGQVIRLNRTNCEPYITVGSISVIGAGSASSIQAGNGMRYTADSRIVNIRQFARPRPVPPVGC
ncbi:MAG: spore germination protein GerPE [Bacillota bacterium]